MKKSRSPLADVASVRISERTLVISISCITRRGSISGPFQRSDTSNKSWPFSLGQVFHHGTENRWAIFSARRVLVHGAVCPLRAVSLSAGVIPLWDRCDVTANGHPSAVSNPALQDGLLLNILCGGREDAELL